MVRIQVLGALTAEVAGCRVGLGGPRQRGVLAQLLAARGEVVPVDRLIDDLWRGRPPAKAGASLQAYVSNLRRLLEPDRGPREAARILVSEPPGYAVRLPHDAVDALRFERLLAQARESGGSGLDEALGLWRGEAYAEFADEPWAATEIARLAELRLSARELRVALTLGSGRAAEAAVDALVLAEEYPLREEGWRLLALALWNGGRQADALDALRRARAVLADELGLDPGPALAQLEAAILQQRTDLLGLPAGGWGAAPARDGAAAPATPILAAPLPAPPLRAVPVLVAPVPDGPGSAGARAVRRPGAGAVGTAAGAVFVGREAELRALRQAAVDVDAGGHAVAIVTGEAGAGKSTLLGRFCAELADAGWLLATGRCPETEGAPSAWAWTEALRELARHTPPPGHLAAALAPILDEERHRGASAAPGVPAVTAGSAVPVAFAGGVAAQRTPDRFGAVAAAPTPSQLPLTQAPYGTDPHRSTTRAATATATSALRGFTSPVHAGRPAERRADALAGRFRLHRAVADWLRAAAAARPVAIVLDDLHAADQETRDLLADLAGGQAAPGLLLVLAHRPGEGDLTDVLARLARRSPYRVPLPGLGEADAGRLIEAVCAAAVDRHTVRALADRTGGNPFYLVESAQLLAGEGALVAIQDVPQGVRDVLRRRFDRLPRRAVEALRLAAVVGREADAEVLLQASDADEDELLDALEAAVDGGLLTEPRPGAVRFTHALVRDTLYADLSGLRRARLHGRVGDALRVLRPDHIEALAHHYTQAASGASAALAVDYCVRAAEAAERRYAHDASAALLRQALAALDRLPADGGDREARRIALLGGLLRAQVRMGAVAAAMETKAQAIRLARETDRRDLLVEAWTAWTEPTPWVTHPYGSFDQAAVDSLSALLARTALPTATRCRLLDALSYELDCSGTPEGWGIGDEAVALARAEGDPRLLAMALAAQARVHDYELGSQLRRAIATELAALATEHDLPAYRWHAEHLECTVAAAAGDLPALRAHMRTAEEIAVRYGMAELLDVGTCQRGMLAFAAGRIEEARGFYAQAVAGLRARGSLHAEGLAALVRIVISIEQDTLPDELTLIQQMRELYGPLVADAHALALLRLGRIAEARAARAESHVIPPDYYRSLFLAIRSMVVIALGERGEAAALYEEMLPLRELVAGGASTSIAMRPVAQYLGELAVLLGRREEAREQFRYAAAVAGRWEARRWREDAERALAALG
ncbi:BTAD domain-containing putative transcriptional regulator [Kitasatospora sp. NPDC050543]|uniref:BTAD domain-containing putative transcriptional regulator n=1 Tax=Kitasatospora sp. NPDC050543 TaxID=3364054 RepID=UPI0037A122B5